MQSTSVVNRSLAYAHEQALSKRKRYDRTSSIYQTRKWRSSRPILTTDQIQELGRLLGVKTLQQSMDLFMNPGNLFQMNKPKLNTIHQYLLDRKLEKGRIATTKLKQYPFAVRLFDILYPGFPIWRANEQALKLQRESVNERRKARPGVAYDQLPTSDIFERLEELVRVDVQQRDIQYPYNEEGENEEDEEEGYNGQKQTIVIPTEGLLNYAQERTSTKKKETRDIRLHLYLWSSIRLCWEPRISEFIVDTKGNQWTDVDQKTVQKHGYKHIDITEKVDWQDVLENRAENDGEILIQFDCNVDIKQASICTVWKKAPIELVGHLYIQTAGTYICRLVENAKIESEIASIQEKAFNLLGKKDDRRTNIYCARGIFNDCMDTFKGESNSMNGNSQGTGGDDDDDLLMGDQVVSLLDPLLFTHIEFPCRGIYCKHIACFDAACFFQCHGVDRNWQCPLCAVQYKSIQDLYIDHDLDQAITRYPEESKLILRDGKLIPPPEEPELHKKIKVEHIL
ncbi:hypothetical protein BDA99DRAFT_559553 [Phascolomyces articulosus]|uniref:SP-RING-type domain-containing protein n=1 Tax=Phascolomyces articulosus TaxID=60185 RepID=A0AAD5K161_9FUNG|nr:hypothetical protein BDA99DRAFT_559553 [Phascolomyces articulosus]